MQNTKLSRFYLPELDGLRFVAFLLVFTHNAPYILSNKVWMWLHAYGWVGVDIFFCLSAFLITKLLSVEFEKTDRIHVSYYYVRRILRIWPLYFFFLGIAFIVNTEQMRGNSNLSHHFLALSLFVDNYALAIIGPIPIFYLVHLWTISFEEQFYLLIPWFVRCVVLKSVKSRTLFLGGLLLVGNIIRGLMIYQKAPHPSIYTLPFTHFESVLGGIAIGLGLLEPLFVKWKGWAMLATGALCIALATRFSNIDVIGWNLIPLYSFVGIGATLITFATGNKNVVLWSKLLGSTLVARFGKISYGLYIYHLVCLIITDRLYHSVQPTSHLVIYPSAMYVFGLSLSLIFATISYRYIEKPFLRLKERYTFIGSRPA